jgi:hypothetical protein
MNKKWNDLTHHSGAAGMQYIFATADRVPTDGEAMQLEGIFRDEHMKRTYGFDRVLFVDLAPELDVHLRGEKPKVCFRCPEGYVPPDVRRPAR